MRLIINPKFNQLPYSSNQFRLNKFLPHSQEIIFLMRRLLNDVKERVFHHYLCHFSELFVQHQVIVVRVVLLLTLISLLLLFLIVLNLLQSILSSALPVYPATPEDSHLVGRTSRFTRFLCFLSSPQSLGRLLSTGLCRQRCSPVKAFLTRPPSMTLSLSGSFPVLKTKLPPESTLSLSSKTKILSHLTKSSLSVKFTNPLKKIASETISHCMEFPLRKTMDSSKMSVSVSTLQNCLVRGILPLAQWQICLHMSIPDDWN
jgi:hypothetical protein